MSEPARRAVVTGVGAVTPLGPDVTSTWDGLLAGRNGIGPLTSFDASGHSTRIAGEIPTFDPGVILKPAEARKLDRFTQLALVAAHQAVRDSGLDMSRVQLDRAGAILGSGIGGLLEIEEQHRRLLEKGPDRVSPFLVPKLMMNAISGHISMAFGLRGVNFVTASACASAAHAIAMALRSIRHGDADIVVTGGSEAAITPLGMAGFCSLRALSTRNDAPDRASRPFDHDRDGFVMGEGAGVLVLEELESARRRGARIYCEVAGAGMTADAHHITQPAPEAEGATRSMRLACADAGIPLDAVDYINAHGTSTPINDVNETRAIRNLFGPHAARLAVSSTKSMIGHLLGASAAVEAVVCALSIHTGAVHMTRNLDNPDPECDLDYIRGSSREMAVRHALSNSLGFGGHNATLAFSRIS